MSLPVWLIPFFPLVGAIINAVCGRTIGRRAHWIGVPAVGFSFVAACAVFARVWHGETWTGDLFPWIVAGTFKTAVTAQVDQLSAIMLLVVTGVSFLIHLYSIGYMHDDSGYARFFTYLNLFVFSMVMLVLAGNFLVLFVFWEGVGLCSYLLIGFWYERQSASDAGKKAFIVNRVGDFGFLLAIMLIWITFGTVNYAEVFGKADASIGVGTYTAIALLLFLGACGKSAQLPLFTWLPDAMEGPTPVSALIHAATMVTAGVYMVARCHKLFEMAPVSLEIVAWVGTITAVFAATIGLVQTDIKRVLAYSTISQLGYMFVGVGVGAYAAGIFHLVTHAFFKALLFLGAGSVIHGMQGEQDLRKMGGLAPRMLITTVTFLVGALGLSGVPPLAGFWSKDEILAAAFHEGHRVMWALLVIGAFMTAFYTFRLVFLAFFGSSRMDKEVAHHVHESPAVMTVPLVVLATLTVIAGLALGIPTSHGTAFVRFLGAGAPDARGGARRQRRPHPPDPLGGGRSRRRRARVGHVRAPAGARRDHRSVHEPHLPAPLEEVLRGRAVRCALRPADLPDGALVCSGLRSRGHRWDRQRRGAPGDRVGHGHAPHPDRLRDELRARHPDRSRGRGRVLPDAVVMSALRLAVRLG